MSLLKILCFVLGWQASALAQPFRPFLHTPIEHGSTEVRGNYHGIPAGSAPAFALYVCGASGCHTVAVAEFAVNLTAQTFTAVVPAPLAQKQFVRVELTVENDTAESNEVVVNDAPVPTVLELLSAQVVYGASKAVIFFKPVAKAVGKPSMRVEVHATNEGLFVQKVEPNEEALKAGKVEVTLQRPVFHATDRDLHLTVVSGDASISAAAQPAVLEYTSLPIREGDTVIAGRTLAKSVKRVCVAVFGPAFTGAEAARILSATDHPATQCKDAARLTAAKKGQEIKNASIAVHAAKVRLSATKGDDRQEQMRKLVEAAEPFESASNEVAEYLGQFLMEQEVNVDPNAGTFEFRLDRPLISGAKIVMREVFADIEGHKRIALVGPEVQTADSVALDFGRVRGVFSIGAVVGQAQDSFAKADPYFSAYFEGNFFSRLLRKGDPKKTALDPKRPGKYYSDLFNNAAFGAALHWFGEARLTQTGSVTAIGATPAGLNQAQSAVFLIGMYAPMRIKGFDWVYQGQQFTAFVAPVIKGGVTVLKDGATLGRTTSTATTSVISCPPGLDCSALSRSTEPKHEFLRVKGPAPFSGIGMRMGVMKYELIGKEARNRQLSGDPQMYLDLTFGQDQAYTTPGTISRETSERDNTVTGIRTKTVTETQGYTFETRLAAEARVKLPFLPAQLGVDVNMNRKAPLRSLAVAPDGTKDSITRYTDFRFLIAFRIDAMKALGRVFDTKK